MAAIHYRVEAWDTHAHYFDLTLTIPAPAALQVVSLPAWIPGSYLLREFVRYLSGLTAAQGSRTLAVQQQDKATWSIACSGRTALLLRYRIYAFDNSVRAAFLDAQRGFFNASSLCLRVHGREQDSHSLTLARLAAGWQVATSMPALGEGHYAAANYDELVDHPFELGRFWRGSFSAGGVEHQVVVSGALPVFDGARLLVDAQRICEAQITFWHGPPAKRRGPDFGLPFKGYIFLLNTVDEGYGGLEHRASTALIAPRRDLPRRGLPELSDGYVRLLGLFSHEYFHSWNVKRLKPSNFAALDYSRENYTELLWFFEGFTSYYDDLMLVRCGLIDETRYLKMLAVTVTGVLATPGRKVQSLAQASFDAWVKYYRPDENTLNSTISYYGKGSLLALALDLSLRATSKAGAACSLDELMRGLWQRFDGGPLTEADIFALLAELGGPELALEASQWVHGTADLPLPRLLEQLGVHWQHGPATLAQRLGLRVSETPLTGVLIKQVSAGSLAMEAGLCVGDEVLACNDWRVRRLDDALLTLAPEQNELRWLVSRDQRLLSFTVLLPSAAPSPLLAGGPTGAPTLLTPADKAPARLSSLRRAWLLTG
jgi:predicted metalloprotease with PDZ domain